MQALTPIDGCNRGITENTKNSIVTCSPSMACSAEPTRSCPICSLFLKKLWFLHTYCYSHFLSHQSRPAAPMRRRAPLRSSISPCPAGEGEENCPEGCWTFRLLCMLIICVLCVVCVNIVIYSFGCIALTWCWCRVCVV